MSKENTASAAQENNAPSKEQIIAFFQEQIEVKKVQADLQELNTKLAVLRAEELKALAFIAQMSAPKSTGKEYEGGIPHTITQEDLDNNPELAEQGLQVGDEVLIPNDPDSIPTKEDAAVSTEPKKERSLKK